MKISFRNLFGKDELKIVNEVFQDSWQNERDAGYQGKYEKLYTDKFCKFQGGGYADAVSSGTAAVYVALKALNLEKGSDVVVSPATDPGGVMPVILAGFNPIVCDSQLDSLNMGSSELKEAITPKTSAVIVTHLGGCPAEMDSIKEVTAQKNILLIEDCSQAHGALYKGKRVGTFGDIAAFSTMFSKNHATGGCGGIVFTKNEDLYWLARAHADRGKDFNKEGFDPKDPSQSLFPAFNFNLDEVSCAIGYSTLSKLQATIDKRYEISEKMKEIMSHSSVLSPCNVPDGLFPSYFFYTVKVDVAKIKVSVEEFANSLSQRGAWLNPKYKFVVSEWKWMKPYLQGRATPNAIDFRNRTFNFLFHENIDDEYLSLLEKIILDTEKQLCI